MSEEFQRLASVRARQRSRRWQWTLAASAVGIAAAIAVLSWLGTATLSGSRLRGSVKMVEPDTGIVRVSAGFLGLMSVALLVTPETVIVVGDKEGGLGDLRPGERVVAAYEIRSGALEAKRIELFPLSRTPD